MFDRRFARRGRTYLLWGLLGFVVVQLGLGLLIDQALPDVRDPEYAKKLRQFRELRKTEPDAPLVVALGSSRTNQGLAAARIRPMVDGRPALVYNFARPGCGPVYQLLMLRRLLADGVRPNRVLVEVMPGFLGQQQRRLMDELNLDGALLQTDEVIRSFRYVKNPWVLGGYWVLGRGLPCYRYAAELGQQLPFEHAAEPSSVDPQYGWYTPFISVTPEQRKHYTEVALVQYQRRLAQFHLAPQPVHALRDLLGVCRRNGIQAVLVVPPEGTAFRALYDPAAFPIIDGVLADLQREWGVPVIDARDWVPDEHFWDTHHLLPEGAEIYTDRLGLELETAWKEVPSR